MKRTYLCIVAILLLGSLPRTAAPQQVETAVYDTVQLNGIAMAYRDIGEGEPLVLLHGFFDTGAMWEPLFDDFAEYRLIVPDLRGHGRSTNPSGEFTHRQAARDVYALLDSLGVERFHGVGGSTGGMTLLHMATSRPERVERMILVAATSYFPEPARKIMRQMAPEKAPKQQLEAWAERHSRSMKQVRALVRAFHDFEDDFEDMNFTRPYLASIRASTLIVHGDRDQFFPVRIPVELYRAIPDSYLWILPNADHELLLFNEAGRTRFAQVADAFLSGAWE